MSLGPPAARAVARNQPGLFQLPSIGRKRAFNLAASNGQAVPAGWTVLDKIAQSVGGLGQREGLGHYWLDSTGLQQRDDGSPCFLPSRWRLNQQREASHRGPFPDQIGDIDGCLAACRIAERGVSAAHRKRR